MNKSRNRKRQDVAAKSKSMRITKRLVNVRRHTTGYIIGGKRHTVIQASKLAKAGRLPNVQVVGNHIQAMPGSRRLTDLTMQIIK